MAHCHPLFPHSRQQCCLGLGIYASRNTHVRASSIDTNAGGGRDMYVLQCDTDTANSNISISPTFSHDIATYISRYRV